MRETNLARSLAVFLEDALKDMRFPTRSENVIRAPKIFDGYLPPKRSQSDDDFPYVVVRAEEGVSEMGQTVATVSLIIGCFTQETNGYSHCLEIMERVRLALCQLECQTLDSRYQLEFPITWSNVPEQPYPQWQLVMTTKWTFNTPMLASF